MQILASNPYIKRVSDKSITYTDEFKQQFVSESLNGLTMKEICSESGFDPEILGDYRMKLFAKK
ncbi:HTH domain-containing protein [Halolactibacillus alkaliphilus]|uniref:HTH domain-containing protein n=1 Tax=Halolactibacillus alkaliphilus TaxID=442899 RepID=UPI0035316954